MRALASLASRGYKPGFLGADRGYTQVLAEHFHLPVRAIGYRIVMDYKQNDLGRQANSGGAVLVDGCFYCPAMPEALVSASGDHRAGRSTRRRSPPTSRRGLPIASCASPGRTTTATSATPARPSAATRT